MKVDKRIKEIPWPADTAAHKNIHFRLSFHWPVMDHERLCVIDFVRNKKHPLQYTKPGKDFRLILSKKEPAARVLFKDENKIKRIPVNQALSGFGCRVQTCYPQINETDEAALKRWLGARDESCNHYMPELGHFVDKAIASEIQAEQDARGELRADDVNLCPEQIPAGLIRFIETDILPKDRVLLYKKGNVRGRCFMCRQPVRADLFQRFRQNEPTRCPLCGEVVVAYLQDSDRFKVNYVQNIGSVQVGADGKTVFFRQWHLTRDHTAEWRDIAGHLKEVARYAVRGSRVAKWQKEVKHNWYMNTWREDLYHWERRQDVTNTYDGLYKFYLPDDWQEMLAETSLRYIDLGGYMESSTDKYKIRNIIRYSLDWARYPAVEKLWKAGYQNLIHAKIAGINPKQRKVVQWSKNSIQEACGAPLRYLRILPEKDWNIQDLRRLQFLTQQVDEGNITETERKDLVLAATDIENIQLAMGHATIREILKYLRGEVEKEKADRKQKAQEAKQQGRHYYCDAELNVPQTYRDYLQDCVALGLDLDDKAVLFPKNLNLAHARTISQIEYKDNMKLHESFAKQYRKLLKMQMEYKGLVIRPAETAAELIAEGKYLHHCVGGYAKRMAEGVLAIFLIRKVSDPDTPYYTLEWSDNRIVQCKTMANEDYLRNPEIAEFCIKWAEWVLSGCKKRPRKVA